jgi:uncharacterized protein YqfA (UPF0365 family)
MDRAGKHVHPLTDDELRTVFRMVTAGGSQEEARQHLHGRSRTTVNRALNVVCQFERLNLITLNDAEAQHIAGAAGYEATIHYVQTLFLKWKVWKVSVNPKVIETPRVAAVAKDGIQLVATARVTVRANIERLVGGAGEETILARVGEGTVSAIGSADSHKQVLESPDQISRLVLQRGLDSGTAYEILSIDIADVDVGRNVGAQLQTDQAEADKSIAQARAEERRAMAVAEEQEMVARTQEMRSRVVEAEAQVPLAISEAFRSGNLGVMDYYRMRNMQADTRMREGFAGEDQGGHGESSN